MLKCSSPLLFHFKAGPAIIVDYRVTSLQAVLSIRILSGASTPTIMHTAYPLARYRIEAIVTREDRQILFSPRERATPHEITPMAPVTLQQYRLIQHPWKLLCQCWQQHYTAFRDTGYSNYGLSRSNRQQSHCRNIYNQGRGNGQGKEFIFDTGGLRSPNIAGFDGEVCYTNSNLRFPTSRDMIPADVDTVDTRTTWKLPAEVKNREKVLVIGSPLRPLRANFIDPESSKKLPTNRFKYALNEKSIL